MNKERRSRLKNIRDQLVELEEAEQTAFDNTPESLQSKEKGEQLQSNVDQIRVAIDALDEILEL